jgi:hypothetical protein
MLPNKLRLCPSLQQTHTTAYCLSGFLHLLNLQVRNLYPDLEWFERESMCELSVACSPTSYFCSTRHEELTHTLRTWCCFDKRLKSILRNEGCEVQRSINGLSEWLGSKEEGSPLPICAASSSLKHDTHTHSRPHACTHILSHTQTQLSFHNKYF